MAKKKKLTKEQLQEALDTATTYAHQCDNEWTILEEEIYQAEQDSDTAWEIVDKIMAQMEVMK